MRVYNPRITLIPIQEIRIVNRRCPAEWITFDPKRFRAYEIEFGAGGQRLGCKFLLDDGSLLFVHETQITPEIDSLIASLGSPTEGLRNTQPVIQNKTERR